MSQRCPRRYSPRESAAFPFSERPGNGHLFQHSKAALGHRPPLADWGRSVDLDERRLTLRELSSNGSPELGRDQDDGLRPEASHSLADAAIRLSRASSWPARRRAGASGHQMSRESQAHNFGKKATLDY